MICILPLNSGYDGRNGLTVNEVYTPVLSLTGIQVQFNAQYRYLKGFRTLMSS